MAASGTTKKNKQTNKKNKNKKKQKKKKKQLTEQILTNEMKKTETNDSQTTRGTIRAYLVNDKMKCSNA